MSIFSGGKDIAAHSFISGDGKTIERLYEVNQNAISSLIKALEIRDKYTQGHSKRVCDLSWQIGNAIGFTEEKLIGLRAGALVHDIGKIGVPDSILNKPGKLTEIEFECIKRHTLNGDYIICHMGGIDIIKDIVRHHHERLDGTGYPDGLQKNDISIEAQIVAVADVYDAITTDRSYRKHMKECDAFEVLKQEKAKGKLNAEITDVLIEIIMKKSEGVQRLDVSKLHYKDEYYKTGENNYRNVL